MNRKGGVPIGADRDPSKSEICAGNQRDGRKSKGSLFGAESQHILGWRVAIFYFLDFLDFLTFASAARPLSASAIKS
jgi:hypothetical protein